MTQGAQPIESCLVETKRGMKRAMLEVLASGAVTTTDDIGAYIRCTLLAATRDFQDVVAYATTQGLRWLSRAGFVAWDEASRSYGGTPLGRATLASGMAPEQALLVRAGRWAGCGVGMHVGETCLLASLLACLLACLPPMHVGWHAATACGCAKQVLCLTTTNVVDTATNTSIHSLTCRLHTPPCNARATRR